MVRCQVSLNCNPMVKYDPAPGLVCLHRPLNGTTTHVLIYHLMLSLKKESEYDQEIPQSHTADKPTAP